MTDTITVIGTIGTDPSNFVTGAAVPITSFRLASNLRKFDKERQEWVDASTNWYRVSAYRQLALNALVSLHKGERVVVTGKLKVTEWTAGEKKGVSVEIDAEAIGHDLTFGTAMFTRAAVPGNHQASGPGASDAEMEQQSGESDMTGAAAGAAPDEAREQQWAADGDERTEGERSTAGQAEETLAGTPF
jgi:single-strand DNA-binding protein